MLESFSCKYGEHDAIAYPMDYIGQYRYFYVSLKKDPGFGPTGFPYIHRSLLTFTEAEPPTLGL